jgi:alpha-L-fucosidase
VKISAHKFTTEHHEGFAIFDVPETSSKRSSIHYGPKRDLLREIFDEAKKNFPELHRGMQWITLLLKLKLEAKLHQGTYFSLPEWYNPAYAKYAMSSFPGGPPTNPYTGEVIPYTGYVDVDDFVLDIQVPQMNTLFYDYDTEVLWCDIGGANNSTDTVSAWLNWAQKQGRQVTYNDRCGISSDDYSTPE